eukprot:TRINITY_DN3075_c0_g1_i1.p1 TRINITY_DN3075_c0_g1~~TRINITY_DN3075_c0_g1_i1.p1  ORF type:complete len:297 (-),score=39.33 TRINITY_DN3075_c0_g1_i1:774-1664(-)
MPEELIQGVHCLHEPKDGTEFDLLFIHGLRRSIGDNQQWRTTWSTRGGEKVCWPEEWLPMVFPKARVLALSYDSTATNHASTPIALWENAINVIQALLSSSVNFGKRPFFLVGHSMGGLLAKEILLRAVSPVNDQEIRLQREELVKQCKGLVFYGVPHLGATAANFADLINTVTFGASGLSQLVTKDLLLFGERCFRRNLEFEPLRETLPTYNFLELEKTVCANPFYFWPVKVMVVGKENGGCSASANNVAFIQADHHEVCRPSTKTDINFANFVSFIEVRLAAEKLPCTRAVKLT